MRDLSVNYPKKQEDEDKIQGYLDKYRQELEPNVVDEMKRYTYGELDLRQAGSNTAPFFL